MRKKRQTMSGCRGHQKQVRTVSQFDMAGLPALRFRPKIGDRRITGQRLQG